MQIAAFLFVGTIALLFAGVQPILLGALVDEHRLTAGALGQAATAEFLAVGIGVGLAGAIFAPTHLRVKGAAAATLLIAANLLAIHQSGIVILLDRALAGLAEGGMVWLTASMIARTATPARWAGVFLVTQGAAQFALAAALPLTVMRQGGADACFIVLAAAAGLGLAATLALPNSLPPLHETHEHHSGPYSAASIWSLLAVFLVFAFFIGVFAYFEQFAAQARLTPAQSGAAVSLAVGLSILGSGVAAVLAKRVSYFAAAIVCLPINLAVLGIFAGRPTATEFIIAAAVFGLFWGFFMPFQVSLVVEVDPTRRSSLLAPGIQALGAAAGPLLCSFFVSDTDSHGALVAMAACVLMSCGIGMGVHLTRGSRPSPPTRP
ncbi:MAG: hypothetical protein P4M09_15320 [Devosia sp.]|nr:hypothetical protein [Devosia sp.]